MRRTLALTLLTAALLAAATGDLPSSPPGAPEVGRLLKTDLPSDGLASAAEEGPEAKLESSLAQLAEDFAAGGLPLATEAGLQMDVPVDDGRVLVIVEARADRAAEAASAVQSLNGQVDKVHEDLVQALVPVSALTDLASRGNVRFVRLPYQRLPLVTGEGVALINADDWHAAGLTGSGVKVAVLDLGFEGYADLLGTELPASVVTHSCRSDGDISGGGQIHGTGVAEIVHEVAPDAQLYLVNFNTDVDLAECVDWLVAQGIDVINHSVGWFGSGPGDGTGPIDDIAAGAVSAGVFWANAAGNHAQRHWSGTWQDGDSDNWHNFAGTDEGNNVTGSAGQTIVAILKWDDPFGAACNNYDLYLYRESTPEQVVASSTGTQSCSQDPVEVLSYTFPVSDSFSLRIRRTSADGLATFHLYTFRHNLQYQTAAGSLLEPADSPDVVTAGAVWWGNPTTIEPFSSQGPTDDGRTKPNVAAPDGVANATYGSFFGTSAASPHAAAAAALVLGANPGWTPSQLQTYLESRAVDLGAPGADNVYGAGRLDLGTPPAPSPTPTPTETPCPDSDGDGCSDCQESGSDPLLGGQRDPLNPYDFFDVPLPVGEPGTGDRDGQIDGSDALAVLAKFGAVLGDPVPSAPKYDAAYDRSQPTPNPWNTQAPDGTQDGNDILWSLWQFGHSCVAP
jgi:subtilisin family serine protease